DSGEDFWSQLNNDSAPSLETLEFSLLALGDSNYDQFCGHGKKLEARLLQLGAKSIIARADCDSDYEEPANTWFSQLQQSLANKRVPANENLIEKNTPRITPAGSLSSDTKPGLGKNNPFAARLIINQRLNSEASAKDIRQFGFDIQDSDIHYSAGDALGVWPRNCPALVHELINNLNLNADAPVLVDAHEKPLQLALEENFEICKPSPEMLKFIAQKSGDKSLLTRLENTDKSELNDWLWGRQLVDILYDLP